MFLKLVIMLVQFLDITCVIAKTSSNKIFPSLVLDVTNPLKALISKNISETDFVNKINLNTITIQNDDTKGPSFLYSTNCVYLHFGNCQEEIKSVSNIINSTLGAVDLTISFTISLPDALAFPTNISSKLKIPDFPNNIIINFNRDTKCRLFDYVGISKAINVKQIIKQWISINTTASKRLGIGFYEPLRACVYRKIDGASFYVNNLEIGYTELVTHSIELFQKLMDRKHKEQLQFMRHRLHYPDRVQPPVVYNAPRIVHDFKHPPYTDVESIPNENYPRLFLEFAKRWTASPISESNNHSVIIQQSYFEQSASLTKFSVGAVLGSNNCAWPSHSRLKDVVWYAPAALSILSNSLDFLHLGLDEWMVINSPEAQQLYGRAYKSGSYFKQIEIHLVFPGYIDPIVLMENRCRIHWKLIEKLLAIQQLEPFKYAAPTTLIFQIAFQHKKFKALVDLDFAHRHSYNYTIGCQNNVHFNPTVGIDIELLVETCKSIGGSVYIIACAIRPYFTHWHINRWVQKRSIWMHYEMVNKYRVKILERHPEASVFLHVDFTTNWAGPREGGNSSIFCDEMAQLVNWRYYAIEAWARLNNIPVILQLEFEGSGAPFVGRWISLLRPQTTKLGFSWKIIGDDPFFSDHGNIRIGLEGNNNSIVDACVEWDLVISNAPPKFQIDPIGAIIDFDFQKDYTDSYAYEIMLQFVLKRFLSIEIIGGYDEEVIIETLKRLTSQGLVDDRKKIFICYRRRKSYPTFAEFVKHVDATNVQVIEGIHFELTATLMENIVAVSRILESVSNAKSEVNVGIILESMYCMRFTNAFLNVSQPEENWKFLPVLNEINYIICKETVNISSLIDKTYSSGLFDRHLYIKRAFSVFQPALRVYFRVEINIELDYTKEVMEPYLLTLFRFREFGIGYDVNYFLVNSFDNKNGVNQNGWWAIQNFAMLDNVHSYMEKESVYSRRPIWYPTVTVPSKVNKVITSTNTSFNVNIAITVTAVILGLLVGVSFFFNMRYRRKNKFLSEKEVQEFITGLKKHKEGNLDENYIGHIALVEAMKFNKNDELSIADLNIDTQNVLGSGNFGKVYKGIAKGRPAAVKTPNNNCSKATFKSFLSEVKVLSYVGAHSNVVEYIGVYTKEIRKGILYIATALCQNGSLETFLRTKTQIVSKQLGQDISAATGNYTIPLYDLHRFASEISNGMEHIAGLNNVHGDLASRNVLLDERFTCKIGDFGLSRKLYDQEKYVTKSLEEVPWKWMAFEVLTKMEFAPKSDVWSYGVVLWEIYSLGCTPYGGLQWTKDFADELRNGLRLAIPEFATEEIYSKMQDCWNLEPAQRPTFTDMVGYFKPFRVTEYAVVNTVA